MEVLDVEDEFDVHEYRHGLKLLKEDRATTALENRKGYACPACGEAFDRLLVTERRTTSIGRPDGRLCVIRTDCQTLVCSHADT